MLYHNANAIGAIGAIWAMLSLYETAEEITKSYIHKSYSVTGIISSVISIALAVLLLFNPCKKTESARRLTLSVFGF